MNFYHSIENIKKIILYRTRFFKNYFQKVVHEAGEFLGNKIAKVVIKSNENNIEKQ